MDEREPLARFISDRSDAAFAELVRMNANLVYSAALRQSAGDAALAEEITQAVFVLLAKKAGGIKVPLAGWLIRATWFAAREARRSAARRQIHERRAALMRSEIASSESEPAWEGYAPLIDEALSRLREKDRQAITLRYLRGLSLREVGLALGLNEEAARKRVDRGINRLRANLAAKTTVPMASGLAMALTAHATQAAPIKLVETIVAAGSSAAKTSSVAALVHQVRSALFWAKAKMAAVVIAIIAVPAAGGSVLITKAILRNSASAPGAASLPLVSAPQGVADSQPTTETVNPEASVPGIIQLAQWDAYLDENGADTIRALCNPIDSQAQDYEAMTGNGAALRGAIAQMLAGNSGVFSASISMRIAREPVTGRLELASPGEYLQNDYPDDFSPAGANHPKLQGSFNINGNIHRLDDEHLLLHLRENVGEMPMDSMNSSTGAYKSYQMNYDGTLAVGDVIAFLSPVGRGFHLMALETFNARPWEVEYFRNQRITREWCIDGPDKFRRSADVARLWSSRATHPISQVSPKFTRTLDDKTVVKLVAISDLNHAPWCWWDAQGNPVYSDHLESLASYYSSGLPVGQFVACIEIDRPIDPPDSESSEIIPEHFVYDTFALSQSMPIGVAIGPWREIDRLKPGQKHHLKQNQYTIDVQLKTKNSNGTAIFYSYNGTHCDDIQLIYSNPQGQIGVEDSGDNSFASMEGGTTETGLWFWPSELRVMMRHRQWISFDGYATKPKIDAPESVTADELAIADKSVPQTEASGLQGKRKIWAAISPDRSTPLGAARAFLNAVQSGDESAACKLCCDPNNLEIGRSIEATVHLLHLGQKARAVAVANFGSEAFDQHRGSNLLLSDVENYLLGQHWIVQSDGSWTMYSAPTFWLRKQLDGNYLLDITVLNRQLPADSTGLEKNLKDLIALLSQKVSLDDLQPKLNEIDDLVNLLPQN